jgi:hypothetical protein
MLKFHGAVKTEGAVAVACSALFGDLALIRPSSRYTDTLTIAQNRPSMITLTMRNACCANGSGSSGGKKKSTGNAITNPTAAKMKSVHEESGTSGPFHVGSTTAITPANNRHRNTATTRTAPKQESRGCSLAFCATKGCSVAKTFMRLLPPNGQRRHSRRAGRGNKSMPDDFINQPQLAGAAAVACSAFVRPRHRGYRTLPDSFSNLRSE